MGNSVDGASAQLKKAACGLLAVRLARIDQYVAGGLHEVAFAVQEGPVTAKEVLSLWVAAGELQVAAEFAVVIAPEAEPDLDVLRTTVPVENLKTEGSEGGSIR